MSESDGVRNDSHRAQSLFRHKVFRHYPGEGSWAMSWVVNRRFGDMVEDVSWRGRAGSITFKFLNEAGHHYRLVVIGVHAAHGALLSDSLKDAHELFRKRPRNSISFFIGDWNVDQLPALPW